MKDGNSAQEINDVRKGRQVCQRVDIAVYKIGFPGMDSLRMWHLRKYLKEAMQIFEIRIFQEKGL